MGEVYIEEWFSALNKLERLVEACKYKLEESKTQKNHFESINITASLVHVRSLVDQAKKALFILNQRQQDAGSRYVALAIKCYESVLALIATLQALPSVDSYFPVLVYQMEDLERIVGALNSLIYSDLGAPIPIEWFVLRWILPDTKFKEWKASLKKMPLEEHRLLLEAFMASYEHIYKNFSLAMKQPGQIALSHMREILTEVFPLLEKTDLGEEKEEVLNKLCRFFSYLESLQFGANWQGGGSVSLLRSLKREKHLLYKACVSSKIGQHLLQKIAVPKKPKIRC